MDEVVDLGSCETTTGLQVRPYRRGDEASCEKIYLEARRYAFPWIDPKRFKSHDFGNDVRGETVGVAELDLAGIVGFVALWLPDNFIHHLYVDPARHRTGIGRALIAYASRLAGPPIRLKCQMGNSNARAFYRHLGFHEGDTGKDGIGTWIEYISPERSIQ